VKFLNFTFELKPYVRRDSNVKFAPLGAQIGTAELDIGFASGATVFVMAALFSVGSLIVGPTGARSRLSRHPHIAG